VAVYPVPTDATYDYVPTTPDRVGVGSDVLAVMETSGPVAMIVPGSGATPWLYVLTMPLPDGSSGSGVAFFPDDWSTLPSYWWGRLRLWKRTAKLADASTYTADDGSKWIYPAGEDGKLVCYADGTTFTQGQRLSLGEITTDARDLYIADDTEWDWLPVTNATGVSVGDYVLFGYAQAGVVDEVVVTDSPPYYRRDEFQRADDDTLGWVDTLYADGVAVLQATWRWYDRLPKPAADSKFRAPDGSRWIYTDGVYYCWGTGASYAPGAVFQRGEIAGRLTEIT